MLKHLKYNRILSFERTFFTSNKTIKNMANQKTIFIGTPSIAHDTIDFH
jgi:hypothetical protein